MAEGEMAGWAGARGARRPLARLALGGVLLALLLLLGRGAGARFEVFSRWVEGLGFAGPVVFAAGYALAVVAFAPASVLTVAAGALFGIAKGTFTVFAAATLGSCLAFLVSRHLARGLVEQKVLGNPKFAAIDRAVGQEGLKIVFLLRLSPVIPFNLLNYALGLTRVRFADYALASFGMLPGTLLYVYSGKLLGDVAAAAAGAGAAPAGAGRIALLGLGLVATLAAVLVAVRAARRALDAATCD
jgi:uncharacterized membrane protein YdjX (TVP38/TMEM64 family)